MLLSVLLDCNTDHATMLQRCSTATQEFLCFEIVFCVCVLQPCCIQATCSSRMHQGCSTATQIFFCFEILLCVCVLQPCCIQATCSSRMHQGCSTATQTFLCFEILFCVCVLQPSCIHAQATCIRAAPQPHRSSCIHAQATCIRAAPQPHRSSFAWRFSFVFVLYNLHACTQHANSHTWHHAAGQLALRFASCTGHLALRFASCTGQLHSHNGVSLL